MTNVPGPGVPLQFCGATLKQTMFWVPASGDIGVGVSILSYGGGVQFGLITDEALCADPQAIVDCFEPEFEKLLLLVDDAAVGRPGRGASEGRAGSRHLRSKDIVRVAAIVRRA